MTNCVPSSGKSTYRAAQISGAGPLRIVTTGSDRIQYRAKI